MKIKPLVLLVGLSLWSGQRVGAADDIPTVPEAEAVASVTAGGATQFYGTVEEAFAVATNDFATIRLLKDAMLTESVSVKAALTLDGNGWTLTREETALIAVTNQSLVVRNVVMSGGATRFLDVYGSQGALTLDAGVTISDVDGEERDMVAAVVVWGGSFTMNSGALIRNCANHYARKEGDALAAGGVVVASIDGGGLAMAFLNGGTVTGCRGSSAGGIYIGNQAKVQIKGDLEVKGNVSLGDEPLNLVVHDLSELELVGEVTKGAGSIGYAEGILGDPDRFGVVAAAALTDEQLADSARGFVHDTNGDNGVIVKGDGKTLLVWHSAVSTAGVYTDAEGNRYVIETAGRTEAVPVPEAAQGLVYNGGEQTGVPTSLAYEILSGETGTEAGTYVATVRLRPGYAWPDGSTADKAIAWTIAKAVYDLSGIVFEDARYSINGPVPLPVALECRNVPAGVTVRYTDDNQQENNRLNKVGSLTVTASFTGDEINYEPIPESFTLTATLTIEDPESLVTGDRPDPKAVQGLVYTGSEQTGLYPGLGYEIVSGNKGLNAGTYVATVRLAQGYEMWADGSTAEEKEIEWTIAKAVYDMSGVTFEDIRYSSDGPLPRALKYKGRLPPGVTVRYTDSNQQENNRLGEVGSLTVTASFTGDAVNYEPIPDMTATLTIYDPKQVEPDPPEPPTPPEPVPVVCQPFKFTAIDEQADGSWKMTLAPGTPYCVYTLYTSDDLSTWTPVGEPLVLAPGAALEFSGVGGELQRFWIVTGADGEKPAED